MSNRERLKLFNKLCKICSRHLVIPKSMHIPDCSEDSEIVESGGFADVSRGTYQGRRVAIKVIRAYITSDLDAILSVSVLLTPFHLVAKWIVEILSRGCCLEIPPAPQYPTTAWSDNKRTQVCSGF